MDAACQTRTARAAAFGFIKRTVLLGVASHSTRVSCLSGHFSHLIHSTAREQRSSEPSPIDAVLLNEPVRDFHHFDEIDLIAIRSLTRIFPDQ